MLAMSKMQPAVGGVEICEIAEPQPLAGEVRVKVAATGMCGTDMHIYKWVPDIARLMKLPVVLGHEISGVVDAVGSSVRRVQVGPSESGEPHSLRSLLPVPPGEGAHLPPDRLSGRDPQRWLR